MLGCLKFFSTIGAIIMLMVGVAVVCITIYSFVAQDIFFSDPYTLHLIQYSLIAISCVIVIIAILGIIGVARKVCCLLGLYQIFVVIFFAVFLALGIGVQVLPAQVFDGTCSNSSNTLINSAYNVYNAATVDLCKSPCPCDLTSQAKSQYSAGDQALIDLTYTFNSSGPVQYQYCNSFKGLSYDQQAMANTLSTLQQLLSCSQWCSSNTPNLIYMFSNVNNGKPNAFCYQTIKNQFYKYSNVVAITSFVVAAVLLLVFVCNICLCCHPDHRHLDMSERFVYINKDDGSLSNRSNSNKQVLQMY